jgi:hypothetical protein
MARIGRIGAGFGLIIAGIFMLVLPGPGIVTIVGGLALLSKDLAWAGRLSEWAKQKFSSFFDSETKGAGEDQI